MGTTDNFDSSLVTLPVSSSTFPVLLTANAGAKNHTLDAVTPFSGRYRFATIQGNLGTLSSLGTSTTATANLTYFADIFIPIAGMVITGGAWLNGTTATTDRAILSLYNAAGTLVANTTVASQGTLIATANTFQQVNFAATYTVLKPGRHWIGYQQNGTTATPRTIATATWIDVLTGSVAGAAGVATTSITPATTFTADTGPVAYIF